MSLRCSVAREGCGSNGSISSVRPHSQVMSASVKPGSSCRGKELLPSCLDRTCTEQGKWCRNVRDTGSRWQSQAPPRPPRQRVIWWNSRGGESGFPAGGTQWRHWGACCPGWRAGRSRRIEPPGPSPGLRRMRGPARASVAESQATRPLPGAPELATTAGGVPLL